MKTKLKILKKKPKVINGEHIKKLGRQIKEVVQDPEDFIRAQPVKSKELLKILDQIYRVAFDCDEENLFTTEFLSELVLEDMEDEQIWQQLELRNIVLVPQLTEKASKIIAIPEEQLEIRLNEENADTEDDSGPDDEYNEDGENADEDNEFDNDLIEEENNEMSDSDDENANITKQLSTKPKKKEKPSIVDDKFFKLNEMEAFLEAEDAKELRKKSGKSTPGDYDGIDFFDENLGDEEDEDDEDEENPDYKDFFADDEKAEESSFQIKKKGEKLKKKVDDYQSENSEDLADENYDKQNGENFSKDLDTNTQQKQLNYDQASDSDSDDINKNEEEKPQSTFELRQARLEQRIRDYEDEVLGDKPWQLKGEVQASNRPQNSLLEEVLEFESTTRPAPIITEATTRRLEDIIKQRIKDKAWDDVVRKTKPIKTPQELRKQLVLDQEKSKQSLAQIYEKDYQDALEKLDPNRDEKEPEEPKENKEIRAAMHKLFLELDALFNFNFTPKPVAPEPRIVTNTPAINMEEVAPVAVSDANLLAPEEVFKPLKAPLMDKSERTKTDKNRERRKKKQKQRAIHKALEAKDQEKQKMGIPLKKKEEKVKLLKSVTKNRNVKTITTNDDKVALSSSKAFFSKLQDTTTSTSMSKKALKKKLNATTTTTAKKVKL